MISFSTLFTEEGDKFIDFDYEPLEKIVFAGATTWIETTKKTLWKWYIFSMQLAHTRVSKIHMHQLKSEL